VGHRSGPVEPTPPRNCCPDPLGRRVAEAPAVSSSTGLARRDRPGTPVKPRLPLVSLPGTHASVESRRGRRDLHDGAHGHLGAASARLRTPPAASGNPGRPREPERNGTERVHGRRRDGAYSPYQAVRTSETASSTTTAIAQASESRVEARKTCSGISGSATGR